MTSVAVALVAAALVPAAAHADTPGWPVCVKRSAPVQVGARETGRTTNGRLVTLTLRSQAMDGTQRVDVLLPRGYTSAKRRYPVLYLLHGAGSDRTMWQGLGIERAVGSRPLIVVMPDGSGPDAAGTMTNGGYTDWFGVAQGAPGPAFAWESYHVAELVPLIDRTFRTIPNRTGRAIMGISMGGGGAMRYAARHPRTFGYAGSLSGALDSWIDRRTPDCKFGDPDTEAAYWHARNPTDLAPALAHTRLFVRVGDGTPGPYDTPTPPDDPNLAKLRQLRLATEWGAHVMAEHFLDALNAAGVTGVDAATYPGSHSKPYWQRELPVFLTWLDAQLRRR